MGKGFQKFVETLNDCKYVPLGTRCAICGKKLGFFVTGFWSVNSSNRHLSDGVLCAKCQEKADRFIKEKGKWMSKTLKESGKLNNLDARGLIFYSAEDIKMLMQQKESSDKENILSYDSRATGLFEVEESFGLEIDAFAVGIVRNKKLNGKTVVFGISEEGTFQTGDCVRVYVEDLVFAATVLEAHKFDKDCMDGRDMEKIFFDELSANLKMDRKIKEEQQGWLILDIDWEYKLDGGRVVKIG